MNGCDVGTRGIRNQLSNAWTTITGIALFHFNDCANQFLGRTFWSGLGFSSRREQQVIFSLNQDLMKVQEGRRLEDDVTFKETFWVHEQRPKPEQESIRNTEVGRSPSGSINHNELIFNQQAVGDHSPCATGPTNFARVRSWILERAKTATAPPELS